MHEPSFGGSEWLYLKECLDSTFVSSVGKFVDRFESELASFTGAGHAVAVVNGTAALHIALKLAGVRTDDEVLIPALTFVATANAVSYCGATPHLVDSEESTLGMDAARLRAHLVSQTEQRVGSCVNRATGRIIRAMVPMHTLGHPVDLDGLLAVAKDFNIAMVEDAAESLGSYYRGQHTGTFGLLGILSFNGNKTITTGGGGAILTNDPELARRAKHLTTTAKVPHRWEFVHDELGYNYRMPNINAALGCAQLEQLADFLNSKRALFERYRNAFATVLGVRVVAEPVNCHSNYWLQTLLLDESLVLQRDDILAATNDAGLMTRPAWTPMHRLTPFSRCPSMSLRGVESLTSRLINLPSSSFLLNRTVERGDFK
ncbi:MAG: LegC family aminotransferase [Sulfuritalea sp.]|nr:LegC family aminotransferase [Sulfuritalea sp.]